MNVSLLRCLPQKTPITSRNCELPPIRLKISVATTHLLLLPCNHLALLLGSGNQQFVHDMQDALFQKAGSLFRVSLILKKVRDP